MQIKRLKSLLSNQGGEAQISAMAWSANNQKFAVCTADRVIHMFDESGEKRDKFSTKPCDPKFGKNSYLVNALAFSPDATMLAVAQSDNIVFVYKIGSDWGDKKSIVAKLVQNSAITCMDWLPDGQIVFGLADGKIRSGNVKKNKSSNVYTAEHYTVSLAVNSTGKAILSGHADGSIVRYIFSDENTGETQGLVCRHTSPPYALAWTQFGIIVGGCDKRVVVYTREGRILQQFDYSKDPSEKELTAAACNPNGQVAVVGSFNRLRIYNWSPRKGLFEEAEPKEIENFYTVTSLAWKKDGSRLAVGNLTGCVELFECGIKKQLYKGKFEMNYVGLSQVIIRNKTSSEKCDLKSHYNYEIFEVKILGKDRYVVAHTSDTLMIGDMKTGNLSEIPWRSAVGRDEKFYFDNENVCMIFSGGELTLVEYGTSDALCSVRTEFMNPHLISVRLNERKQKDARDNKKMAYLIDLKTVSIIDLATGVSISQIQHDQKIDWLELNETAKYLLFRDKKMRLHMYYVESRERFCILNFCSYVQWVPDSDVVVAQNRNNLCIWYNIEAYQNVTMVPIKGEIQEIKKEGSKTNVVINEGVNIVNYELDSGLIEFATAMEDNDLGRAVEYLESVPINDETETMWKTLARVGLENHQFHISERCYAALGDVAKARYLRETNKLAVDKQIPGSNKEYFGVKARIAQLDKNFKAAESIFLENHSTDEAIGMYQNIYKWDEAIEVAEAKNHPDVEKLKKTYYQWLNDTEQFEKAGQVKEREGDFVGAIHLYMRSNMPAKAAKLLTQNRDLMQNQELVGKIATSLINSDLYENAGELFEKIRDDGRALECYKTGKCYRKAVDLARHVSPQEVVVLEREWGDHLASQKLFEAAINHYIEAGESLKAVDAAIHCRQWKKAVEILQTQDSSSALAYYKKIADHFAGVQEFDVAEKFYLKANHPKECIEMYNKAGKWERAFKIATSFLTKQEVTTLYGEQARQLEQLGRYKEAEKLYVIINDPNMAIQMYKRIKNYDNMLRLIKEFHPDMVADTYIHLAKELEAANNYRQAETYYIQGNDWKSAVNMYRRVEMWDEAYRCAKNHGGPVASKQIAYIWAKFLGGEAAVKLLTKFNMLEQGIDYALENYAFDFAFELAKNSAKDKLPEIHTKYAMYLEDEGRFGEAEQEFIRAQKPKEAVLMYIHNKDWDNAQRVAEKYDPSLTSDVLIGQARLAFEEKNYQKAEGFLLRAQRPELAINLYKENDMWSEAFRVCKDYLPNRMEELKIEFESRKSTPGKPSMEPVGLLEKAAKWESAGEHAKAVECYLNIQPSSMVDKDTAIKCWLKSFDLSQKFLSEHRTQNVAQIICPRLIQSNKASIAAEIYLKVDLIKDCVDAFIAAEEWGKAKKVAEQLDKKLIAYVEDCYKQSLEKKGDIDQIADYDAISALEMYVRNGQWDECLKLAEKQNENVLNKYVAKYSSLLIPNGQIEAALDLFKRYGTPAIPQNFNIYQALADKIFKLDSLNSKENYQPWSKLRDVLQNLNANLAKSPERDSQWSKMFQKYLYVAHFNAMRCACADNEQLDSIAAKISISLLRYIDLIPADKAFYEAGIMCRKLKWDNMAFIFLNRYIDLADAIDEGNGEIMESEVLNETDIPNEISLPSTKYLTDDKHEEIKTWVISMSMNKRIDLTLNKDARNVYEASLFDHLNNIKYIPCVVTGYPVLEQRIEFKNNLAANTEDWNKFLMISRMEKSDELLDCVKFLGVWCQTNVLLKL